MRRSLHRAWLALALASGGCADAATSGGSVQCGGESRKPVDCSSEVAYQGALTSGGFGVAKMVGAEASHEEVALRRVDEETERYMAMQTRLCRDYNACVLDQATYARETREIRDRVGRIPALAEAAKNASAGEARTRAIDDLYRGTVADERRVEELSLRFAMKAELPRGGGPVEVAPGGVLPTGARVSFEISASRDAHVYIFQRSPKSGLTVLFPDAAIGTSNPVRGGEIARIPGGTSTFRLDDEDLGTETVFVAASREPIADLGESLRRVASGKVATLEDDGLLRQVASIEGDAPSGGCKTRGLVLDGAAPGGCSRSRGLVLDAPSGSVALSARTEPGDGTIVKAFPFEHVTEAQYAAMPEKRRRRGATIQE